MLAVNCSCDDAFPIETLADLRADLMTGLGFGSAAPPAQAALMNLFLKRAQEQLYRRYSLFRLERFFTWSMTAGERFYDLTANDESAALPVPQGVGVTTATTGGTLAAGTYAYRVTALNANGETLASAEVTVTTTGTTSKNTVTWAAVVAPANVAAVTGYRIYGRATGTEQLLATVGLVTSWTDDGSLTPAGVLPARNTTAVCTKLLDPRRLKWVGISQGDTPWIPLIEGIPPEVYADGVSGYPSRYEIRQCIEVWPAPADNTWQLRIKGDFGLLPFEADADTTTIDPIAIGLLALANAKAHYGQPDAGNYAAELRTYLGDLCAASHGTRRYVPGTEPVPLPPLPKMKEAP